MIGADYALEELITDALADAAAKRAPVVVPAQANDIPLNEAVLTCERIAAEWHERMAELEAAE